MTTFLTYALIWYLIGFVSIGYFFYDQGYKEDGLIRVIDVLLILLLALGGIITLLTCLPEFISKLNKPQILEKVIYERKDKIEF